MTRFKLIILAVLASLSVLPTLGASPYRGQKSMGVYAGYVTRNESAAAGIYFQYRFARYLRISPSAGYIFRHRGEDAFNLDIDFHVPFALGQTGKVNIYPIAGIGYSGIGEDGIKVLSKSAVDDRHRIDRLGFNLGGGLEYFATSTCRLAVEGKWRYRSDYPTGIFTVSVGYCF